MAERTHIPSSPACGQWETLLADALDGLLKPEDEAEFTAHMAACPACTALFEESRRGGSGWSFSRRSLRFRRDFWRRYWPGLAPDRQPAGTGNRQRVLDMPYGPIPAWQKPGFMGFVRRLRAALAHDGGDGVLFDRADAEYDGRSLEQPAGFGLRPTRFGRSWSGG